jgi:hypothetical protein
MRPTRLCAILIVLFSSSTLGASGSEDLLLRASLRLWGAEVALGWRGLRLIPGVDTVFWVSAGGGYDPENYFAGPDDPVMPADHAALRYHNFNFNWRLGVAQGILYNREEKRNLLELILLYRGKHQYYLDPNGVLAGLPDSSGLLQNSLFTGLVFDNVRLNLTYATQRGLYLGAGVEFVPQALANTVLGASDYIGLSLVACGFLTFLETRALSAYLADRVLYDQLIGDDAWIPLNSRSSFGALSTVPIGRYPFHGLGGALRGISIDRFDGYAKLLNNLEVRLHYPSLTLFNLATPGLIVFFDAGVFDHLSRQLLFEPIYCTTGLGLAFYGLGYELVLYGAYFINENRFSPVLEFSAHF